MSAEQTTFTFRYFCEEMCRLRDAWGTKAFWQRSEDDRQAMLQGLLHVYANIEGTNEEIESAKVGLDGTLYEYSLRAALIIKHPEILKNAQ